MLRAYIDETGDRGMKSTSSTYFAFSAMVCRESNSSAILAALDGLLRALRRTEGATLHWAQNMKDHADRKYAAATLAQLPVRLIYVVVPKRSIKPDSFLARSSDGYYNYAARLLLERIGMFTSSIQDPAFPGRPLQCKVTFSHVKGFNPETLRRYISNVRSNNSDRCWRHLTPVLDVDGQSSTRQLQWADIAAGALDSAIKADRHGNYEPAYWRSVSHLVDAPGGIMLGRGLKVLGDESCITDLPWWPIS